MKVFLSYTVRDGLINEHLLKIIESELSKKCDIYIDLLHNHSASPQGEVVKQLRSSDVLVQISTPSIDESNWALLEKKLAEEYEMPVHFVTLLHSKPNQLIADIVDIIESNNSSQKETITRASA